MRTGEVTENSAASYQDWVEGCLKSHCVLELSPAIVPVTELEVLPGTFMPATSMQVRPPHHYTIIGNTAYPTYEGWPKVDFEEYYMSSSTREELVEQRVNRGRKYLDKLAAEYKAHWDLLLTSGWIKGE